MFLNRGQLTMSFTDIKTKSQGFTIVELLIVVVVIAILAAITIVSYNGITTRANQSAIKSTVASVQKKAEAYNAENNIYPTLTTYFTSGNSNTSATANTSASWYLPSSSVSFTTPTTAFTTWVDSKSVRVLKCAASAASQAVINDTTITGLRIIYWDPTTANEQQANVGITTVCPTNAT